MKHPLLFFAVVLFTFASYAQHDNEYLEKGSIWLEGQVGLNFSNNELARIGEKSYFNQTINNSFRFQLIPKLNFAIANRLLIGPHIGYGYLNYTSKDSEKIRENNYKAGGQLKYYFLKIIPQIYLGSEIGLNYNYINRKGHFLNEHFLTDAHYGKSYLNFSLNFFIADEWIVEITFKDIFTWHSSTPNPTMQTGVHGIDKFRNWINFPHFSLLYRIN